MAIAPHALTLRCYGVGFGDCFLLTFHYADDTGDRHMLIDFGSTERPAHAQRNYMGAIVKDIEAAIGAPAQLHVLVATHRHPDHINGFATRPGGRAPRPHRRTQSAAGDPAVERSARGREPNGRRRRRRRRQCRRH